MATVATVLPSAPPVVVLIGRSHPALGRAFSLALGAAPLPCDLLDLPNANVFVRLPGDVEGRHVVVFQSAVPPRVDSALVETLELADAARRAGARSITAVLPYLFYARTDKAEAGAPVTARVVADCLEAVGVGRVVCVDLHGPHIPGFFRIPVVEVSALPRLVVRAVEALGFGGEVERRLVVVAPDLGGFHRARRAARVLGADTPLAMVEKARTGAAEVAASAVVGEVRGRVALVVDDEIATAGTLVAAAEALRTAGAETVHAVAAHPVLVGPAAERLAASGIGRVVVADTLPTGPERLPEALATRLDVVTVADLLAEAVRKGMGLRMEGTGARGRPGDDGGAGGMARGGGSSGGGRGEEEGGTRQDVQDGGSHGQHGGSQ